jgi:drug/metabolite transporter (DMT)-like permease
MNLILFLTTTLIWGSTWLAIKFQLGEVLPLWSLIYRFSLAAGLLIGYCLFTRRSLSFNRKQHGWIALQSLFMYFLNYVLFYFASSYFVSGIIATIFATMIVMNIINGRIFLGNPIEIRTVIGAITGMAGLGFIIWAEIVNLEDKDIWFIIEGVALSLGATVSASLGQMVFITNVKRQLPVIQINALGYAYGSFFTLIVALFLGQAPGFDLSWSYVSSLLYLASFGTVIAFLCYLTLADRIGPEKSAYAFVLIPIIAMSLSSLFEDLTWTTYTFLGITLVLAGNILVMVKKIPRRRSRKSVEAPAAVS